MYIYAFLSILLVILLITFNAQKNYSEDLHKKNTETLGFSQEVRALKQTNCAEISDSN